MTKEEFKEYLRRQNRMAEIEIEEIDLPFDSCLFRQYGNVNTWSDMMFDGSACGNHAKPMEFGLWIFWYERVVPFAIEKLGLIDCQTPEELRTINETIDLLKLTVKSLECVDWHRTHEGYNSIISIFGNYMIPVSEEEAAKELKRRNDAKRELMPWERMK